MLKQISLHKQVHVVRRLDDCCVGGEGCICCGGGGVVMDVLQLGLAVLGYGG